MSQQSPRSLCEFIGSAIKGFKHVPLMENWQLYSAAPSPSESLYFFQFAVAAYEQVHKQVRECGMIRDSSRNIYINGLGRFGWAFNAMNLGSQCAQLLHGLGDPDYNLLTTLDDILSNTSPLPVIPNEAIHKFEEQVKALHEEARNLRINPAILALLLSGLDRLLWLLRFQSLLGTSVLADASGRVMAGAVKVGQEWRLEGVKEDDRPIQVASECVRMVDFLQVAATAAEKGERYAGLIENASKRTHDLWTLLTSSGSLPPPT